MIWYRANCCQGVSSCVPASPLHATAADIRLLSVRTDERTTVPSLPKLHRNASRLSFWPLVARSDLSSLALVSRRSFWLLILTSRPRQTLSIPMLFRSIKCRPPRGHRPHGHQEHTVCCQCAGNAVCQLGQHRQIVKRELIINSKSVLDSTNTWQTR
jgi:hypothetical protein